MICQGHSQRKPRNDIALKSEEVVRKLSKIVAGQLDNRFLMDAYRRAETDSTIADDLPRTNICETILGITAGVSLLTFLSPNW